MGKQIGEFPMTRAERCRKYRAAHLDKEKKRGIEDNRRRAATNLELLAKLRPIRCDRCGYDKCFAAIDMHHTDPTQKQHRQDSLGYWCRTLSPDKFMAKVLNTKYELLCSNCHRELHNEVGEGAGYEEET